MSSLCHQLSVSGVHLSICSLSVCISWQQSSKTTMATRSSNACSALCIVLLARALSALLGDRPPDVSRCYLFWHMTAKFSHLARNGLLVYHLRGSNSSKEEGRLDVHTLPKEQDPHKDSIRITPQHRFELHTSLVFSCYYDVLDSLAAASSGVLVDKRNTRSTRIGDNLSLKFLTSVLPLACVSALHTLGVSCPPDFPRHGDPKTTEASYKATE